MKCATTLFVLFFALLNIATASTEPLAVNQAFVLTATARDYQTILFTWKIAPGYYLYKQHFAFRVIKPASTLLGMPLFPSNTQTLKTMLGDFFVYADSVTIPVPIINAIQGHQKRLVMQVRYQGCSKAGYCYPPISTTVPLYFSKQSVSLRALTNTHNRDIAPVAPSENKSVNLLESLLKHHSFIPIIFSFLGIGVLLSLTPCVLPMIPILSSLIVGREKMTRVHSFLLSLFYVFGMAISYAIVGVLFGAIGANIQIIFQQTWIIVCFSALCVAMALSLFGLYHIQLPEKLRSKIANTSYHQKSGTYIGAFVMGVLSTLILSPCVTPPLVAALGYISQTGSALIGGTALFAMGIGIGAPLLLIGALGPNILPKSGAWMNTVKNMMGILLLSLAIVMLQRVISANIAMILWAALSIGVAVYLDAFSSVTSLTTMIKKGLGLLFFIYSLLILVSLHHGNTNPLSIFNTSEPIVKTAAIPQFENIQSLNALQAALTHADKIKKPVLLDFYADWCIACKEFDAYTLANPAVQQKLAEFVLLRADITQNTPQNQQLMRRLHVIAPPTILFFKNGHAIHNTRVIGFQSSEEFLRRMNKIER